MYTIIKKAIPSTWKRHIKGFLSNLVDSSKYRGKNTYIDISQVKSIIFICKGNICRSPFAEYYMKLVNNDLKVSSCGLDVDQGICSPPEAVKIAKEFGVSLNDNRSKSIKECDVVGTDVLIPMDYDQYQRLMQSYPAMHEKIFLLRSFAPKPFSFLCNIDDPFGADVGDFRRCYALMKHSIDGLLNALNKQSQVR